MLSKARTSIINLKSDVGKKIITKAIESVDWISVMKLWEHFMFELKQIIGGIDPILNLNI